ncbi:MAG: DUF1987 domain-containing protein [Bacteroidetes bacterium]|nr:DUF1987 domain-containing protein [Bacteroidota bacterium]MBU1718856.1 DUF1987 domain-containing protein [Bacteroidota bacterium]
MDAIRIKGTDDTPAVTLDVQNGVFEFSGRSLPEDVTTFYAPILDWIDEYAKNPGNKTNVVFKLEYFNTESSKLLLDVLMKFEGISNTGHEVLISWCYMEDDANMLEAGEEYSEIVDIPFENVSY